VTHYCKLVLLKRKVREPRESPEPFEELALLQVPRKALGTGVCSRLFKM
jgi:hypothetical protein